MSDKYQGWSPFTYAINNPIRFIDPNGMGPGDPVRDTAIRANRASNLFGFVRTRNGVPNSKPHQGFDYTATIGTVALAVATGIVYSIDCSDDSDYGLSVTIQYQNSNGELQYAFYAHLSDIYVSPMQPINEGEILGLTGISGNANPEDPHLHFENRSNPNPGQGLTGRNSPNNVVDTKFFSQNSSGDQRTTGVMKVSNSGNSITFSNQNLDGSSKSVNYSIVPS